MGKNASATNEAELTPLRKLSARIGRDPLLIQANTGNSSIKVEGVLYVQSMCVFFFSMRDGWHTRITAMSSRPTPTRVIELLWVRMKVPSRNSDFLILPSRCRFWPKSS